MKTDQQLYDEGHKKGYNEAVQIGYNGFFAEIYADGFAEGYMESYKIGARIAKKTITEELLSNGKTPEEISSITEYPLNYIQKVIDGEEEKEIIQKLIEIGDTDEEICKELGTDMKTVQRIRKEIKK